MWDALRVLGAERIGHGTSSAQDPALLEHLAATGIPLEVCPSSNIATRAVATLEEHPLRAFVDAGVVVTINSDDPPMFGTTLNREYEIAADLLDLDEAGVADLARTAVRASFAPDDVQGPGAGGDRRVRLQVSPVSRGSLTLSGEASPDNVRERPITPPDLSVTTAAAGHAKALRSHTPQGHHLCTTAERVSGQRHAWVVNEITR